MGPDGPRLFIFHKPLGVEVTRPKTLRDRAENPTVYDLLPKEFHRDRWMPVGRLDKDSSGLLLFVREGPLVARLQKPGVHEKVYEVTVRGPVEPHHLSALHKGVATALGSLQAEKVEHLGDQGNLSRLRITLRQGKNRHIRRLFNALRDSRLGKPLKVMALKRVRFGSVPLDLAEGKWRFLEPGETERVLAGDGRVRGSGPDPGPARPIQWPSFQEIIDDLQNIPEPVHLAVAAPARGGVRQSLP